MDAIKVATDTTVQEELSPNARKCYFSHEYQLKIYRIYSFDNCIHECKLLKTYDKFKCLPWNLPSVYTRYKIRNWENINILDLWKSNTRSTAHKKHNIRNEKWTSPNLYQM